MPTAINQIALRQSPVGRYQAPIGRGQEFRTFAAGGNEAGCTGFVRVART